MQLKSILEAWLRDVERTKRPATLASYRITTRQLLEWRPELGERTLTRGDLIEFRNHRADACSVPSANRAVRALKACLNWVWLNELEHPRIPLGRLLLPVEEERELALTREERRRILDAASLDLPVQTILRICDATGFRLAEALNLWWRDVDPETGSLTVSRKPNWTAKSKKAYRTVRAPRLVVWLNGYRKTLLHRGPEDYVCQQDRVRGRPWNYPRSTRIFARMRPIYEAAGVDGKKLTHSLRHAVAGDLVSSGASIHAAQKHLGHANAVTTLQIYAKARQEDVDRAGELLEQFREEPGGEIIP